MDDPKPPAEEAAAAPPPNRLPAAAAGALPAPGVEPNAEDVPKENDVGVLCEEAALNPVKPAIVH